MRRYSGEGASLAEVLIATGILAGALVPLFLMQGTALLRVRASRSTVYASALASELAEQVRLVPFAQLPTAAPLSFRVPPDSGAPVYLPGPARVPLVVGRYPVDAQVTLALEPLTPPDLLARLTITVQWTEGEPKVTRTHVHVELVENRTGVADVP